MCQEIKALLHNYLVTDLRGFPNHSLKCKETGLFIDNQSKMYSKFI